MEARGRAQLSQRDLAARLGVPPSWVAKVEKRERRLDAVELVHLARALDADPVELFRAVVAAVGAPSKARAAAASGKPGRKRT